MKIDNLKLILQLSGFVSSIIILIYFITVTVVLGPADKPSTEQLVSQIMHCYQL